MSDADAGHRGGYPTPLQKAGTRPVGLSRWCRTKRSLVMGFFNPSRPEKCHCCGRRCWPESVTHTGARHINLSSLTVVLTVRYSRPFFFGGGGNFGISESSDPRKAVNKLFPVPPSAFFFSVYRPEQNFAPSPPPSGNTTNATSSRGNTLLDPLPEKHFSRKSNAEQPPPSPLLPDQPSIKDPGKRIMFISKIDSRFNRDDCPSSVSGLDKSWRSPCRNTNPNPD